jgi:hypothetical protein
MHIPRGTHPGTREDASRPSIGDRGGRAFPQGRPRKVTLSASGHARYLIAAAARAPSVRNSQPRRFRVGREAIELLSDPRRLAWSDAGGRETLISLRPGCWPSPGCAPGTGDGLHRDRVCDRVTAPQMRALHRYTALHLRLAGCARLALKL